jgi:hypothetical protein
MLFSFISAWPIGVEAAKKAGGVIVGAVFVDFAGLLNERA